MEVGLSPGEFVLGGDPAPPPQKGAHVYCGQTAAWIKMPFGTEVGLGPRNIVLDGDPAPLPKRCGAPQFSAHVYCGQTAGWIKMALGIEVGLGPGHIVLDGDRAPLPKKGTDPPIFSPFLLWPNGTWMHQEATWYGCVPQTEALSPGDFVLDRDPAPSPKRGVAPNFWPTSIVVKRLHGSRCHLVRR